MLVGADLSTIICPSEAVIPIKSYSPDVIVSACMHDPQAFANILSRQHVIVIGPGLGRCEASVNMVISCLDVLKQLDDMPLVMDADALWCISQSEIIRHKLITLTSCHRHIFLTPNIPELLRLQTVCKCTSGAQVATHLGVTMIEKGETDVITSAFEDSCVSVNNIGSKKRVGGLGDILSGVVATFIAWYIVLPSSTFHSGASKTNHVATYAAAAACFVTREAARLAYEENGRGLVASQVPAFLSRALQHALDITEENN